MKLKKPLTYTLLCVATAASTIAGPLTRDSLAASEYSILSNSAYLNKNSMSKSKIQSFLSSKKSSLATYTDKGINDSKKELASTIIYNAAQAWNINPQVLIATLQKEQSLITNQNPSATAYRSAMGYDCPDGADCNAAYYGFANQVNIAAYQFRYNYEALRGSSSFIDGDGDRHGVGRFACNQSTRFYNKPLLPGNTVTFKRNTAISGTKDKTIIIANKPTASFLCYTPHVGPYATTGYSGSDNFVYWFKEWFGSTQITVKGSIGKYYATTGVKATLGAPIENESATANGGFKQCFDNGCIVGSSKTGYWMVKGSIGKYYWSKSGPSGRMGLPVGVEIKFGTSNYYQKYQGGYIIGKKATGYWSVKGSIRSTYDSLGGYKAKIGIPLGDEKKSSDGVYTQKYVNGYIIGKSGKYYESSGKIREYWLSQGSWTGRMGVVTGPITTGSRNMVYQHYSKGVLIINPTSQKVWESKGSIRAVWASLGYQTGKLGFPTGPETLTDGIWSQTYEHGVIETKNGLKYKITYTP